MHGSESTRHDIGHVIDERARVRAQRRHAEGDDRSLRDADVALRALLAERLTDDALVVGFVPRGAPGSLRRQIIDGEQVHRISDEHDLDRRLASDRRIATLSHVDARDRVLVFVEIALWRGLAGDMAAVLDTASSVDRDHPPDTAIFYSINTCSEGLAGLGLGSVLLERLLPVLADEVPTLEQFSTLSPIPGLRDWLDSHHPAPATIDGDDATGADDLRRWTARYLVDRRSDGRVVDPVGNFHLGNGAEIARVCWRADRSEVGRARSHSMMVNYRYDPDQLRVRAEGYRTGEVAMSSLVASLVAA